MKLGKLLLMTMVACLLAGQVSAAEYRIDPDGDCTVRANRTPQNYNATGSLGLLVKDGGDGSYLQFTLDSVAATQAKLMLWQDDASVSSTWEIVVRGDVATFSETGIGNVTTGLAWPVLGTFTVNPAVKEWRELDITSWYNANLGQTVSFFLGRDTQPGGGGPVFEDREGTRTSDALAYGPRIVWVPEPASLLLLASTSVFLLRRRSL